MPQIVITNWMLSGRSGTETYTRDLALSLSGSDWEPVVFTLAPGALTRELNDAGVRTVTDPRLLPADAEIVHGHHNFVTIAAMLACPRARGVFVCHDAVSWHDRAPRFPRITRYAGVDEVCRERVALDVGMPLERVHFIGNSVDLSRFPQRGALPEKPARALLFSNYAAEHNFLPVVREACERMGLALDVIGGGVGRLEERPEDWLRGYDIVFAKARCAMEALVTGCATILCGLEGVGPMVDEGNFDSLRRNNFGRRCLSLTIQVDRLVASIREYNAERQHRVGLLARERLDLRTTIGEWTALYESMRTDPVSNTPADDLYGAAQMLGSLSPELLRLFELRSVNDFLHHEIGHLQAKVIEAGKAEALRAKLDRTRQARDRYRSDRDRWKAEALSHVEVKGLLGWLGRHSWTRPLVRVLGLRPLKK